VTPTRAEDALARAAGPGRPRPAGRARATQAGVDLASATSLPQRLDQLRMRQRSTTIRRRRQPEHGHRVAASQIAAKDGQRRWVEGPQGAADQVGLPLAAPDQLLMAAGQHLDRLDQARVAGHPAVMMAVGAHQIDQHPSIPTVGLGPRGGVPLSVAAGRQRVDRDHLVAGRDQRPYQQAPVGFDPDHHLGRVADVHGDQLVQPSHAHHPISDPLAGHRPAVGGHDADVVVAFCPIDPDQQHRQLLSPRPLRSAWRRAAAT
jgi:hypothetical protein